LGRIPAGLGVIFEFAWSLEAILAMVLVVGDTKFCKLKGGRVTVVVDK